MRAGRGSTRQRSGHGGSGGLALELLVHGVGGATPEEMLGDARTERVTGDYTAAVHRRTADVDAEERPLEYAGRTVPEAYCWSHLTSGKSARALWLLLLPFMIVNLAYWMRPPAGGRTVAVRLYGVLMRLLALSLTVLLVAAACEVAMDLVAWQCAGSAQCVAEQPWLGFLAADPHGTDPWWSQPGRRLALAAVVPAILTMLLWWLSHRTWSAYESQAPWRGSTDQRTPDPSPEPDKEPALSLPGFWYGRRLVARLRAAHTAAGFLTVAAVLVAAAVRFDREPGGSGVLQALGWSLTALVTVGVCWVLLAVCGPGREERVLDEGLDRVTLRVLPGASAAVLCLAVLYAGWSRPGWRGGGRLPGGGEVFGTIAVTQGLLVAGIAAIGLLLYHRAPVSRTVLRGLGAACTALLACAVGGVMSGGVTQRVADWLGDGDRTDASGIDGPPTVLTWQASMIPVLLFLLVVTACWYGVRLWRATGRLSGHVHCAYTHQRRDASRSRRIAGAIAGAGLTDATPRLVGVVALGTLLLGGVAVLGTWITGQAPARAANGTPAFVDGFAGTLQTLGSWLIGLGFLLLVTLGRRAYRDAATRRTIGILWDVGTFWPRAAHPFAPPCYAERAVPDLVWRVATWTQRNDGGRLVLSGHSQGSVLAAAAAWQLDRRTRRQVALLTYGSPLERLYGRWFPAYFGSRSLQDLHQELDCWRNLWRLTDPIGGAVRLPEGSDPEVDRVPLRDPLAYERTPEEPLPAPILGHGEYQTDPAFKEEREALIARLGRQGLPRQPGTHSGSGRSSG